MTGAKVNNYAQDDSNILELQLTTDKTFKGYHQLTLTEYDTTTVPAIAAGSAIECNGALYKFDTEEAISTTDPVTSATVADGTVYVCIVPGTTTCTAAFTATAPTWSDSKQGWYGTGGQANHRYSEYVIYKSSTSYSKQKRVNPRSNEIQPLTKTVVSARLSANQNSTSESMTVIFNSEILDTNSEYDVSNGKFTAKYSGYYLFGGIIAISNSSANPGLNVLKNGSQYPGSVASWSAAMSGNPFLNFSFILYLIPGDYIELSVMCLMDTSWAIASYASSLNIIKI